MKAGYYHIQSVWGKGKLLFDEGYQNSLGKDDSNRVAPNTETAFHLFLKRFSLHQTGEG